jgi:hypothetical protein
MVLLLLLLLLLLRMLLGRHCSGSHGHAHAIVLTKVVLLLLLLVLLWLMLLRWLLVLLLLVMIVMWSPERPGRSVSLLRGQRRRSPGGVSLREIGHVCQGRGAAGIVCGRNVVGGSMQNVCDVGAGSAKDGHRRAVAVEGEFDFVAFREKGVES